MGKKARDAYSQALHILQQLKIDHPTHTLGQHLSTALSDYGDLWGITDKEVVFALEKYQIELDMNLASKEEVDRIVKDAQNLDTLFQEEEEDYEL